MAQQTQQEIIASMTNLEGSGQDTFVENYSQLAYNTLYEMGISNAYLTSDQAAYILAKVVTDLVEDGNLSSTTLSLIASLRTNHPHSEDETTQGAQPMYKPANIREFVTPAEHKKPTTQIINGHNQKTYTAVGTIKGKFKQKNTSELNANGIVIVETKITFTTWWSNNLTAQDILTINNIDYEIVGDPENVEQRSRYAVLTLRLIKGGA